MVTTAESCTGGLVAAALTEVAGSSQVVDRGLVTYSNEAKSDLLGVPAHLIEEHGAVSAPCALAMAKGALAQGRSQIAVSVTGIAGPGGGSELKPVGTVFFCAISPRGVIEVQHQFGDLGRHLVREKAVMTALGLLIDLSRP